MLNYGKLQQLYRVKMLTHLIAIVMKDAFNEVLTEDFWKALQQSLSHIEGCCTADLLIVIRQALKHYSVNLSCVHH